MGESIHIMEALKSMNDNLNLMRSEFKLDLQVIKSELHDFKTEIKSEMHDFKKEIKSEMREINVKIHELKTEMQEMKSEVEKAKSLIGTVNSNLQSFRGTMFEASVRRTVKLKYGEKFGENIVINGLDSLANLCGASKSSMDNFFARNPVNFKSFKADDGNMSNFQINKKVTKKLLQYIYSSRSDIKCFQRFLRKFAGVAGMNNFDKYSDLSIFAPNLQNGSDKSKIKYNKFRRQNLQDLENTINSLIKNSRSSSDKKIDGGNNANDIGDNGIMLEAGSMSSIATLTVFHKFIRFAQLSREEQNLALESNSGIAILLFCSSFDLISDLKFPIVDLEVDCQGNTMLRDGEYFVEIGEIKSSIGGIEKAKLQLQLRLMVAKEAIKIMFPTTPIIHLMGRIFLPLANNAEYLDRANKTQVYLDGKMISQQAEGAAAEEIDNMKASVPQQDGKHEETQADEQARNEGTQQADEQVQNEGTQADGQAEKEGTQADEQALADNKAQAKQPQTETYRINIAIEILPLL